MLEEIVRKIIHGVSDWTPEELQYQLNYPQKVETALMQERLKTPIRSACEGIMIVPYSWNHKLLYEARKYFKIHRFLFVSDALVLALYHEVNISGNVFFINIDIDSIEIGIYNLMDGVFESVLNTWIPIKYLDKLPLLCKNQLIENGLTGEINQYILTSSLSNNICLQGLQDCFQKPVLQISNYESLVNYGARLEQGILNGTLKSEALLIQTTSQSIRVENKGKMVYTMPANNHIPCRHSEVIEIFGNDLQIRQGNEYETTQDTVISNLEFKIPNRSMYRKVEFSIFIDEKRELKVTARDLETGETLKAQI